MNGKRWPRPALTALCAGTLCFVAAPAWAQLTIYQSGFEGTNGGWVGDNDWARGIPSPSPAPCDGGAGGPASAFEGLEVWATGLDTCYTNCGCDMRLTQNFDLSTAISPELSFQQFLEVFGNFDFVQVNVNGNEEYRYEDDAPTGWEQVVIDLSAYAGQSTVTIEFLLHATAVVNRPGWYIDDVRITSDLPVDNDLGVDIAASDSELLVGNTLTYTVTARNRGNTTLNNVVVNTTLDPLTTYLSSSMGLEVAGTHMVNIASLAPLSSQVYTIDVSVDAAGTLSATANGTATEPDPDTANNTASVSITGIAGPMNDNCTSATVVSVPHVESVGQVELATAEPDIASCNSSSSTVMNNSIWWSFVGDGQRLRLTMDDINMDAAFAVYEVPNGSDCTLLSEVDEIACSDPAPFKFDFDAQVGMTYYFVAMNWPSTALGDTGNQIDFSLDVAPPAPANDECVDAVALTFGNFTNGTTLGATQSTTATCGADERDVWYAFAPTPNTAYRFTATFFDTAGSIAAFDSCGGGELACDTATTTTPGFVDLVSDSLGSAILLRVATDTVDESAFDIVADLDPSPPPANDECENAVALIDNTIVSGSTAGATQTTTATCGADELDVWYAFAPAPNTAYRFTATFFDTGGSIAAFAGCGGAQLGCGTATTTTPGFVDVVSDSLGSAILLRVATDTVDESLFDIVAALDPTPPPANDDCDTATVVTSLPFNEVVLNDAANGEPDRVTCNSGTTVMNQTVWWRFDGTGQRIAVTMNDEDFDGGTFDGAFAAFEGTDCTNMVQIGCSDPAPITFTIDTVPGMSYFFVGMTWSATAQTDTGNEVHIDIVEVIRTGGCCAGGSCSIISEADCNTMGGVYLGDDTACSGFSDTEAGTFMDISGTGIALNLVDDGESTVATSLLGNVRIANNGGVAIGAAAGDLATLNTVLPATGTFVTNAAELYFPFWDDLDADIGNVYWQELGDRVIVQWNNRPHFSGSTSLLDGVTFQVQLFAPGSDIKAQYLYQDVSFDPNQSATGGCNGGICDGGASATVGYQDASQAVMYSFNSAVLQNGMVLSVLASACPAPTCACETDGNAAQVNVFDLLAYLNNWFPQNAAADIDGTPGVNVFDLLFFLDCWFPASAGNPC